MDEQTVDNKREEWVDNVKSFACILVVFGHFFQSMTKAGILPAGHLYELFNATIYYFHVPLFFICSGYLYQRYSKVDSVRSWQKNVVKKAIALGIPYTTFTIATWILKTVFSSDVNSPIGGLIDTLLFHPTSPYWYLYALFFIFVVTPTFSGIKVAVVGLVIATAAKLLIIAGGGDSVYAVSTVLSNEIWFVLGMSICVFNVQLRGRKLQGMFCGLLFGTLSIVAYIADVKASLVSFVLGMLACTAVLLLFADYEDQFGAVFNLFAKYTLPIFLMHTLFAAPLRLVLLKLNITNGFVHAMLGLGISFIGPIIAAWIMKKTKWLEFFLYPKKLIKKTTID